MTDRACVIRALSAVTLLTSLFLGLALIAHHAVAGTEIDRMVLGWMVHHRSHALTSWATAVTDVGSPVGIGALALAVSAVLWWRRGSPWPAAVILATMIATATISTATKIMVGAHRPPQSVQLILETDPSFPSGHVAGTVALLGALTAVTARHVGRASRAVLITATVVSTAAVVLSRLYLGVHWVSDTLGGLLLGVTAAVLAGVIYRYLPQSTGSGTRSGASSVSGPIPTVGASPE